MLVRNAMWLICAALLSACSDDGISTKAPEYTEMKQQPYEQMPRPVYPAPQYGYAVPAQPYQAQPQTGGYPVYQQQPVQPQYGYQAAPSPQTTAPVQIQPGTVQRNNPWATGGSVPEPRYTQPQTQTSNVWNQGQQVYQPQYQQPRFRPLEEDTKESYSAPQYQAPYDRVQGTSKNPGQTGTGVPYGTYPQGYGYGYGATPQYIHPGAPYPGMVW